MTTHIICCHNLSHRYGDTPVITDFELCVHEGEFVALLGRSGSGKTTLLRLIAGFERPTQGTIEIAGRRVAGDGAFVPPEKRRVGMVFQDYALFPHLTVLENVCYGLRGADTAERARDVLELVGLGGLDERMPGELSGGQQQRVALARALAPEPAVVLLDEPFSNLDAGLRARLRVELRDILQEAGATAIFVTHDQEEALSLADRVAVLREGHIEQFAPPEVLYRLPATREIAEFVGEANFVPGCAEGDIVTCGIGRFPLPLCRPASGDVDVMLRPEWIAVEADPHGEAAVLRRMYFGHDQLMRVELADGTRLEVRLGPDDSFQPGDRVRLHVPGPVVSYPRHAANGRRAISAGLPAVDAASPKKEAISELSGRELAAR